jgi:His-Xaa-Ser system protein HxsD
MTLQKEIKEMSKLDNNKDINESKIKIKTSIYPLEVIYSAAYSFLDKAYILIDGDPEKELIITISSKGKEDSEILSKEFGNELINFADYNVRAKETKKLRETIIQRSLLTNDPESFIEEDSDELEDFEFDDDFFDDPEGIAIPWEEKYGKNPDN